MSDDQLLQVFIEEAKEILVDLDTNLVELEDNPDDQELINKIFRAFHTLKGSASLTGLSEIADFVHHGEDLLDQVRNGQLQIDSEIINLLLQVHDLVEDMVTEVTDSDFEVDREELAEVEASLKYFLDSEQQETVAKKDTAEDETGERVYKIKLELDKDLFATGTDPMMLLEELSDLGELIDSNINLTKVPEIYNFDPEECYLTITVLLRTEAAKSKIEDVFVFIEFDSNIE
ncbi:MAG: Hpt domain-containing protein, partial [Bacillota bacterium]